MHNKILSLLMAVVLLFSAACPSLTVSAKAPQSLIESYSDSVVQAAQDRDSMAGFTSFMRRVRFAFRALTGQLIFRDENFNVTVDDRITEYCMYICENAGLDIVQILTTLPESNHLAELTVKTFRIDTAKMRDHLNKKCNEVWGTNPVLGGVYMFLAKYFSIMDQCEVLSVNADEENVFEVVLRLTYRDGGQEELRPGIFINSVTGEAYNRDGSGMLGLGFNCSIYDLLVYTPINAWMRNYGFCLFYDLFVYASPDWMWRYETRRFKFDYDGKEWMIQIWKGNYMITNGCEIGLYNRDKLRAGTYYDCASDADMLEIGMRLRRGDEEILSLDRELHWWRNGFKMCRRLYDPNSMTMDGEIVMRDEAMLQAFCKAIDRNYRHDVTYATDGLTVSFTW